MLTVAVDEVQKHKREKLMQKEEKEKAKAARFELF